MNLGNFVKLCSHNTSKETILVKEYVNENNLWKEFISILIRKVSTKNDSFHSKHPVGRVLNSDGFVNTFILSIRENNNLVMLWIKTSDWAEKYFPVSCQSEMRFNRGHWYETEKSYVILQLLIVIFAIEVLVAFWGLIAFIWVFPFWSELEFVTLIKGTMIISITLHYIPVEICYR